MSVFVSLIALATAALACQVPVFRFALERWVADAYQVSIAPGASGKFSAEEQAAVDFLKSQEPDRLSPMETGVFANLDVEVSETPAEGAAGGATMTVTYPQKIRGFQLKPIWEGPLTMENARLLIDSPARRELVKRLLAGQSAIWVLIESGDPETDDAAADTVAAAAGKAKETLRIPDGVMTRQEAESAENFAAVNADDVLRSEVPLKIDFSVLRIGRNDPAEALFLPMVLNIEDDLSQFEKETMVFPVFGRGRLLEPLIGRGIHADNVIEYGAYICGACSCEVKDQNPGVDLLFTADWDAALHGSEVVIDKILPPLEGTGILAQAASVEENGKAGDSTEPVSSPAETAPAETEVSDGIPRSSVTVLSLIGLASALVVILGLGTYFILRRKTP
ncbi:MAG: hypothetical protein KDN19_00925 [Verrucomicrobiae bacterium]|nr:hypothetical protein [Verrucomicrobiae bacterium]